MGIQYRSGLGNPGKLFLIWAFYQTSRKTLEAKLTVSAGVGWKCLAMAPDFYSLEANSWSGTFVHGVRQLTICLLAAIAYNSSSIGAEKMLSIGHCHCCSCSGHVAIL